MLVTQYNTHQTHLRCQVSLIQSTLLILTVEPICIEVETASSIAQWYSAGFECGRSRFQTPSQGPRHTKDVIKMAECAVLVLQCTECSVLYLYGTMYQNVLCLFCSAQNVQFCIFTVQCIRMCCGCFVVHRIFSFVSLRYNVFRTS